MTKTETKIDWVIHSGVDEDGMIWMHTHGLKEKGLAELSALQYEWEYTPEEMAGMINTVALMMIEGEEFMVHPGIRHIIDDEDGSPKFYFRMSYDYVGSDCLDVENKMMRTVRLHFVD